MNTKSDSKQKPRWLFQLLSFGLPFLLLGVIGYISSAMDTRGFENPDYANCWFFFFLFGLPGGLVGLSIRPIIKWWREPHE
jgi:hypothetical protein